jgi:hypothetical protein
MTSLALLLALSAPAADAPKPAPAKVTITAELVCQHCTFGIEDRDGCGACLKLDEKTPVLLNGKVADGLLKARFDKKIYVAEGTLALDKEKRLVLTVTSARERTDADKGKAPEAGQAFITGKLQAKDGKLSIENGDAPLAVESKTPPPGSDANPVTATGKLTVKDGKPSLEAASVQPADAKK